VLDPDVLVIEDDKDNKTPRKQSKPSMPAGPSPKQIALAKRAVISLESSILNTCTFLKGMEKWVSKVEGHVTKSEQDLAMLKTLLGML
jgi:hypothetical protein